VADVATVADITGEDEPEPGSFEPEEFPEMPAFLDRRARA